MIDRFRSFLSFSTVADNISNEGSRRRRNSDSFLSLSPKEDEVTLMLLNQAENKWNFKMQILEIEIDKLKTELAICGKDGRSINKCQRTYKLMT